MAKLRSPVTGRNSRPLQCPLSDGGHLFFETSEALILSDTNGRPDVYEYENGQQYLISSGTGTSETLFIGASSSGNDVFFLSRQKLVPQDTEEEARVIYDVRVDGGFAETASPPACATPDACRAAPVQQPAIFGAPSSATFSGAGNLLPAPPIVAKSPKNTSKCAKGEVRKGMRCTRASPRKKKPKKRSTRKSPKKHGKAKTSGRSK